MRIWILTLRNFCNFAFSLLLYINIYKYQELPLINHTGLLVGVLFYTSSRLHIGVIPEPLSWLIMSCICFIYVLQRPNRFLIEFLQALFKSFSYSLYEILSACCLYFFKSCYLSQVFCHDAAFYCVYNRLFKLACKGCKVT